MDIKAKIEELVAKVKDDKSFGEAFKKDPVQAVEKAVGVDLPDDVLHKIVDGVKAAVAGNKLADVADKLKNLF